MTLQGRIIAAHGRHYLVDTGNGEHLPCVTRGKKSDASGEDEPASSDASAAADEQADVPTAKSSPAAKPAAAKTAAPKPAE